MVSASPLFHVCMHSACQVSTAVIMQLWAFISLRPTVTPSASHLTHASIILSTPHSHPTSLPQHHFFFCHIPYSPLALSQFATCRSALNVFMFLVFFFACRGHMFGARQQYVCVSWERLCVQSLVPEAIHTQVKQPAIKITHSWPLSRTFCESPSSLCLYQTPRSARAEPPPSPSNASPLCTGATAPFKYLEPKRTQG